MSNSTRRGSAGAWNKTASDDDETEGQSEIGIYCEYGASVLSMIMKASQVITDGEDQSDNETSYTKTRTTTTPKTNITKGEITQKLCDEGKFQFTEHSLPGIFLLTAGIASILALVWVQRRKHLCLSLTDGRPAVLRPFPIIDPCRIRFTYIAFWAMVAFDGIQILLTPADLFISTRCVDKWEKPIVVLLNVLLFSVLYFPVIGGFSTDTVLGYMIATAWMWALFLLRMVQIVGSFLFDDEGNMSNNLEITMEAFQNLVPVVSMMFLFFALPVRLIMGLCRYYVGGTSSGYERLTPPTLFMNTPEALYVQELFKRRPPQKPPTGIRKLLDILMFYRNVPYFRYSHVILSTLAIGAIFIYYILFGDAYMLTLVGTYWLPFIYQAVVLQTRIFFAIPFVQQRILKATGKPTNSTAVEDQAIWAGKVATSHVWYSNVAAVCVVGILQIVLLCHLLIAYRNDRLRAQRGQYQIIDPPEISSGRSVIGGGVRYMGFQAVMFAWGVIIQLALFTLVGIIVGFVFVIPLIYGYGDWIIRLLFALLPALAVTIGLAILQQLLAAFAFTVVPCGRIIAVNNPRWYSNYAYLSFFKNLFVGIVSALLRLILSVVIGAIIFSRLDMPTLTPRFKRFDTGFKTYEAFIHLENAHLNPTLITFVNLVVDRVCSQKKERRALRDRLERDAISQLKKKKSAVASTTNVRVDFYDVPIDVAVGEKAKAKNIDEEYERLIEADRRSRYIRFKWQLLRTLACNPILAIERKMKLRLDQFRIKEHNKENEDVSRV